MVGRSVWTALRGPAAWLVVGGVAAFYAWAATELLGAHVRGGAPLTWWVALVAPPTAYAGLIVLCARGLPPARRLTAFGLLCVVHASLALLTGVLYAVAGPLPFATALGRALWGFPGTPLLQLLTVPLLLFPFRHALAPSRKGSAAREPSARATGATSPPARVSQTTATPLRRTQTGRHSASGRHSLTPESRPAALVGATSGPAAGEPAPAPAVPASRTPTTPPRAVSRGVTPTRAIQKVPAPPAAPERSGPTTPPRPARTVAPANPVVEAAGSATPPPSAIPAPRARLSPPAPASPVSVAPASSTKPAACEALAVRPGVEPERAPVPTSPPSGPRASTEPGPEHRAAAQRIAAVFGRAGSLSVDVEHLMGVTLFTVLSPRVPRDAIGSTALRFLPLLDDRLGSQPVSQATLRGAHGAIVLTPLGPAGAGGPVLVVALRERGRLALLEGRARDAAAAYRASHPEPDRPPESPEESGPGGFDPEDAAVPPAIAAVAGALTSWGPVAPWALGDPAGPLRLYLIVPPTADRRRLAGFARALYRATEMGGDAWGVGVLESITLQIEADRVVIRPVSARAEGPTLLVVAGEKIDRPGLAHRELERAAGRIAVA